MEVPVEHIGSKQEIQNHRETANNRLLRFRNKSTDVLSDNTDIRNDSTYEMSDRANVEIARMY